MQPNERKKLDEVYAFMQSLKSSNSIPLEVDRALRDRLLGLAQLSVSTKGADTEDVTVNEGGAATYAVMNDPVGFLQTSINGTTYYVPYFT